MTRLYSSLTQQMNPLFPGEASASPAAALLISYPALINNSGADALINWDAGRSETRFASNTASSGELRPAASFINISPVIRSDFVIKQETFHV